MFTNLRLLAVVVASVAAQFALAHVDAVGSLFQVATLGIDGMLLALGLGLVPVTVAELAKVIRRRLA